MVDDVYEDDESLEFWVVTCRAPFNPKKVHGGSIKLLSYANQRPIPTKYILLFPYGIGQWYP
ncbi:hypothetical protein KFK09_025867 [Dendrobium nobile]|uniref:Uncharacterized protein n=1 Tax=Dendrobium nobile TaxID=94219 RepID=A0A8T3A507_DENNO|nr:hypothetical protein KFK09_025867 [Dendrobium nobile]